MFDVAKPGFARAGFRIGRRVGTVHYDPNLIVDLAAWLAGYFGCRVKLTGDNGRPWRFDKQIHPSWGKCPVVVLHTDHPEGVTVEYPNAMAVCARSSFGRFELICEG